MLSKEEIKNIKGILKEYKNYIFEFDTGNIKVEYILKYIDQLETKVKKSETDKQKLIETNDKYLQKLVYALTPTTHELSTDNNNAFKQIIADNIDLETCKIRRKLKEFWGIDKY